MPGVLKAAAKRKAASAVTSALARFNPFGGGSTPTTTATVSTLQKILTDRGVRVARDGLYGPKTAGAWKALAQSKGLPTTISREGPKVAKVATQAIETLAVPPIP
jgi:peptidoglycan hydrolase-like protein with peptidoglycan-binding domain